MPLYRISNESYRRWRSKYFIIGYGSVVVGWYRFCQLQSSIRCIQQFIEGSDCFPLILFDSIFTARHSKLNLCRHMASLGHNGLWISTASNISMSSNDMAYHSYFFTQFLYKQLLTRFCGLLTRFKCAHVGLRILIGYAYMGPGVKKKSWHPTVLCWVSVTSSLDFCIHCLVWCMLFNWIAYVFRTKHA